MGLKPGYKQTDVGRIPEDWEATTVGQAFEICNNLRMPISQAVREKMAGPFPYYGPTSVQGYINEYRVDGEYALIGEDGDHFLKWQNQPMTQLVCGRFNVNNHAHLIKGTKNLTAWFYYYFSHRDLTPYLTRQGAGRYKLTKSRLMEIPCALPPTKAEQEAIAEVLSGADTLIESLEQLIVKKRHLKQGAMQELLCPKPSHQVRLLREISTMKGRIGWQGLKQEEFTTNEEEPFLITGMNFKDGAIRWDEVYHVSEARYEMAKDIQLRTGDVLMTKDGTIGKVLYIDKIPYPVKASLNSHLLVFRPIKGGYNPKYLYYQLSSQLFKDFIELSKSGTTFFGLSQAAAGKYPVLLPPMEDQDRIATILSDMDAEIAALEAKLTKARQLKQGMMQELLTGKIRLV